MRQFSGGLLLALFVTACTTTKPVVQQPAPPQPVVLTLGNKAFTTDDFFQSFTKNQLSADSSQHTDIKQYFDLYTNLKLKVVDAEAAGLDTTEAFREELATYRKQLAQSYLTDKTLVESLAAEAYQRMQQEINASHILVALPDDTAPYDTLIAYQTALALRKRLTDGEDFAAVARTHSQDAVTASEGGSLGWFTAFSLVYPLENAAYATSVGQVAGPVRTKAGYHLLRVNNRRPSRGKLRVAHILVRMSPGADATGADASGQTIAKERIDAASARLRNGESFETVARSVSDDVTSKTNGGQLPAFETGKQVPAFEEAAFALANPGDISAPVRTNYGWHIIKLLERTPLPPYTDLAPTLRQRVTTDTRAEVLRQSALQRLRTEYAVRENKVVVEQALAKADSNLLRGLWQYTEPLSVSLQNQPIVTIADQPYTVNQFFGYVRQRQQPRRNPARPGLALPVATPNRPVPGSLPTVMMRRLLDRFIGDQLLATEENNLEKKSPEFRALLAEIRDGILLSQQMETNVWERSMADSTGQRQLFEQNKANYQLPRRVAATVIEAPTDILLQQVQAVLTEKMPYQLKRAAPDLRYAQNQTSLTPENREQLRDVLVAMARNPDYVVEVAASHQVAEQDSVSAGRIRAVVVFLRQYGVALNRIMERDYQSEPRPGSTDPASQRRVSFQYYSTAKTDVAKAFSTDSQLVTISEGLFAPGTNPYIDQLSPTEPGTTILHPAGKAVAVLVDRIEPPRARTFAEARGTVINEYQAILERQWLAQLRQKYPVNVNQGEMGKLAK